MKTPKKVLSAILSVAFLVTALPVFAQTPQLNSLVSENINKYNCYIFDTTYYDSDSRIFTVSTTDSGNITSKTEIKNYTATDATMTVKIMAVSSDGEKTEIQNTEQAITSDTAQTVEVTCDISEIPSGTAKLVTDITSSEDTKTYSSGEIPVVDYEVVMPVQSPADSNDTTFGVHDPSIVKYPDDPTYYVYSSHHLIFTSKDLIHWKKYDFANQLVKDMAPKTCQFIIDNIDSNVNGTYWAPDVIYKEGDDHPYWMYISVSCGLGGRNSAIGLVKSDNPLFWADPASDIVDEGVVFATKQQSGYKTNAIDTNIYTDSNGKQYFIWGSFWQGIQGAMLKEDGFVEGIDYTSPQTILSSSMNFGKSLFEQRNGTAGPEGAWTIEHGDYRYMFTSYGWLGSNYNTRIARSPLSTDLSTVLSTPSGNDISFVDANGVTVGTEYSKGSNSMPSGYKLIGSYRLGEGQSNTIEKGSDGNYFVSYKDGDAHVYYGPGHNSAIKADDGNYYYVSHTRKDYVEGAAWLQVRKMLWTEDGWPVVSPITYAGEKEQKLPYELIPGTYDFASVGHTKRDGGSIQARNFDLPVLSSKITLNDDGTLDDGLGTWEYDGDHTVTISFTKDGDESQDEFYKSGDVVKMYALLGYNKDESRYEMALTGIDQNHITQFATKAMVSEPIYSDAQTITSDVTTVSKSTSNNPILGFDENNDMMYGGDPTALVDGDTVYIYVGHDISSSDSYVMSEWVCYSSKNMTDWTYEGPVMSATDISWRNDNTSAWASQAVKYNDKYYLYYCTWDKTSNGKQSIGVAVSDSPTGPFKDIGQPLVKGTFTEPETNAWDDIDPTVLIDTDENGIEHRYLAWGNSRFYICELNEDMISIKDLDDDGEIVMHLDVKERKIKSLGSNVFTEAPWLYKRDGKYYLFFAMNWREEMAYAMADDPMGRWDFKQTIMPPTATSNTNHPAVIDFNGKTYFIYHNGMLPNGSGYRRSVCIQELEFDENGYIYPLTELSIGLGGTANTLKAANNLYLAHEEFTNPLSDSSYPLSLALTGIDSEDGYNSAWEIVDAKYVPDSENAENYVSIQSVNKPGLYIAVKDGNIVLTQDYDGNQGQSMSFKTVQGLDGSENTVSFESVLEKGKYITVSSTGASLTYGLNAADSSFSIGAITPVAKNEINVADVEPEYGPSEPVDNNLDSLTPMTIMTTTNDPQVNESIDGVILYMNPRNGTDSSTSWSIASGGVTGNALVMTNGRFVSGSRGPCFQLATPSIPDGATVTGSFMVKLGDSTNAKLFMNDSHSVQATAPVSSVSASDWAEIKTTIKNDGDTYFRTIYVNGTEIQSDYIASFPIFWGTDVNETYSKLYFDNINISTDFIVPGMEASISQPYFTSDNVMFTLNNATIYGSVTAMVAEYSTEDKLVKFGNSENINITSSSQLISVPYTKESEENTVKVYVWHNMNDMIPAAEPTEVTSTENPNKVPEGYTSCFAFDDNLTDSVTNIDGTTVGSKANLAASSSTASYAEGYNGKAVSFTGNGGDGVNLGKVITNSSYTVSFKMKANEFTEHTPGIFIDANGGTKWVSAPIGWQTNGLLMIWSNDEISNGNGYIDLVSNYTAQTNKWYQVTITATGGTATMYVDGVNVGSGKIADVINENTNTYLAVNYWDTPFNGYIDDLYIYNGKTLSADEVYELYLATL